MVDVNQLFRKGSTSPVNLTSKGKEYEVMLFLLRDELFPVYKTLMRKIAIESDFTDFWKSLVLVHPYEVYYVCVVEPDGLGQFLRLYTVQVVITLKE